MCISNTKILVSEIIVILIVPNLVAQIAQATSLFTQT